MKKTIPFYLINSLLFTSLIGLSACSNQPLRKASDLKVTAKVIQTDTKESLPAEELQSFSQDELRLQIKLTAEMQDWTTYIQLSNHLWQQSDDDDSQAEIEQDVWNRLKYVDSATIDAIRQHHDPSVQAWATLLSILNGPAQKIEASLQNLSAHRTENNDKIAIYQNHLLPELQQKLSGVAAVKQIAVLLPFQGKYEQVSKQIQNGMLKAFLASDQSITLKFYDSFQLDQVESVYHQAKREGADFVIGPLRKEALEQLVHLDDPNILALNKIEAAAFYQFSFKSADEISQMIALFNKHNYRHIGILSNDGRMESSKAQALQEAWQEEPQRSATLSIYPDENPKLRDALEKLINAQTSQARYNNLRWSIGQSLSFFPRMRQDFDAIVILDNRSRIAVFKPQFAFFELKVPVYGSTQLSPKNLQDNRPYVDLKGVKFLTYPASLNPDELNTPFEAYGWDSFQLVSQMNKMRVGAILDNGKTGLLSLNEHEFLQKLVWAQYNNDGLIESMPPTDQTGLFLNQK
ncbi:penicillin-binding protein activator [Thiomicrorhabdus arctica]|uniref:penicillin-binding protein activator n=1 Tax=Thiomicrorhabdus arctica TaxID=131540 RepID=UPI0003A1B553|nr:penicillin-binding protein activator [Thiomicrorhabdus arctica]